MGVLILSSIFLTPRAVARYVPNVAKEEYMRCVKSRPMIAMNIDDRPTDHFSTFSNFKWP